MGGVKHTMKDVGKVFKGPKWKQEDYRDLLCLLFGLIRIARANPVEVEQHIEDPENSPVFSKYPKILADSEAINLICDTMRSASMNYDDPHQVEEVLEKRIEANLHHALHSSHALQAVADALPALGIVAAVLGVIKTMGSIDQPPEVLGKLIGGALVGTFLGVFLAYGLVGPFAAKVKTITEEDGHFYQLIREVLVANLHNHAAAICIEVGRQNTPSHIRPGFSELEEALKSVKQDAA
jgi:chemotaxis protein MotA